MNNETLLRPQPRDYGGELSNFDILLGPPVPPEKRVRLFSPAEWEEFIEEFADALGDQYRHVRRVSGPRDKGRDVIGYYGEPNSGCEWDNYQCKHYEKPLQPNEAFPELGKLCYYTWRRDYSVPKAYFFVAPRDLGPTLASTITDPNAIKAELIAKWNDWCSEAITKTAVVKLEGHLLDWVNGFDFSIVKHMPLKDVLEVHSHTRFHARRFGNGLCKPRPKPPEPPDDIKQGEVRYVEQLLSAYSQHIGVGIRSVSELADHAMLDDHLKRQRRDFYSAEALKEFSRDTMPNEEVFASFKDEIYDAVIDKCNEPCSDGFERVNKTTMAARSVSFESHALSPYMRPRDKAGVCHQLANEDLLKWVQ